ncbi:hypothetical protein L1987_43388 [Smallanthus sonchifolius]|uniref:Uncharacterized protein n=1 Tax=Smallanthus sonchifolius TaxID=185202 RepID=A0ACB9GMH1_9ASTR|nr:hypothetical protein L1987_43388 [Smallanthus sonchifolius]
MLEENPDPEFGIDDEVDDILCSGVEDNDGNDDDDDDDDDDDEGGDGGEGGVVQESEKVQEVSKVKTPEVSATATKSPFKRKEVETEQTVPPRPPPSKGIMIKEPELKRLKTIAQRYTNKRKRKEVPDPVKQKVSKDYKLIDEEFANFATQEIANVISQLKTQIANLQSREASNEREIRELRTSDAKKQQVHINKLQGIVQDLMKHLRMSVSSENVTAKPVQENVDQEGPSTSNLPQYNESLIIGVDLFGSQDLFDVDSLINQQGEGMEVDDEVKEKGKDEKEEEEEKKEEEEEVIITDIKKDDKDPSDDDDCSNDGFGIGGGGSNDKESSDDEDSNKVYEKYEYEEKQTYVEGDGNMVGRLDRVVDERIPFDELFEESETSEAKKESTTKKESLEKSLWWKTSETPSIVERITQKIRSPRKALTGLILGWKYDNGI